AQAAKLRHGDGEAGFAHGVHGRRQDRQADGEVTGDAGGERDVLRKDGRMRGDERYVVESQRFSLDAQHGRARGGDRKSTRLNSSHVKISYAVVCLKKKKKQY